MTRAAKAVASASPSGIGRQQPVTVTREPPRVRVE
jgi:hypothetical protein